jgi:hypothetical protein
MLKRSVQIGFAAVAVFSWLLPEMGHAQVWEVEIAWVQVDHDYAPSTYDTGEQVPVGFGISARRSLKARSFFLELEYTRGAEERPGAICGGFVQPGDCVLERVGYSGGVSMLSLGWLGKLALLDSWSIGLRPEIGLGLLRASEDGKETGKTYRDRQTAASIGLGFEVGFSLPDAVPVTIAAIVGWNHLRPISVETCDDCRQIFRHPLPQLSLGLGVRWDQHRNDSDAR